MDVTVRKRAEEGLRESEARFRDYAKTASDWFWEMGPDWILIFTGQTLVQLPLSDDARYGDRTSRMRSSNHSCP
jgi:PAS domain-containing protein